MIARAGNEAKMMGNDYIAASMSLLALLKQERRRSHGVWLPRAFIIFRSGRMSPSSSVKEQKQESRK